MDAWALKLWALAEFHCRIVFTSVSKMETIEKFKQRRQTYARKRKSKTSLNFTFNLNTLHVGPFFTWLKSTCVNVRSQKRVSGNQPLLVPAPWDELERSLGTRLGQPLDGIWNEFVRAGYNWNITWSVHNFSQIKLSSMIGAQRVLCFFIRLSTGNALFESWSRYSVKLHDWYSMLVMTYDKSQAAGKFSEAGFMFIVEI